MKDFNQGGGPSNAEILKLIIEGKTFDWKEQFILGKQVRELGGAPIDSLIFLAIRKPWEDEQIGDEEKVDLARPGIEQFYFKPLLLLTINGKEYKWYNQYITGEEIKNLANIPLSEQLWLEIEKPWEDEKIKNDDKVDLARPGKEHFISGEKPFEVIILVNGQPKSWKEKTISYDQVVKLAKEDDPSNTIKAYTIVYFDGPPQNPKGELAKGQSVFVINKMKFNATPTDKS